MLSRNTTWTFTRDTSLRSELRRRQLLRRSGFPGQQEPGCQECHWRLDGASFCIQAGTTTELNLADYFRANKMGYTPITFDTSDQTVKAFDAGRCDALTSDQSQLYALRIKLKNPDGADGAAGSDLEGAAGPRGAPG